MVTFSNGSNKLFHHGQINFLLLDQIRNTNYI
jgi:hypothetical protein